MILIVDDEAIIRKSTAEILERKGYAVATANRGEEAIESLSTNADRLSLIILDLNLSDIDGAQVFRIISNNYPAIPVILTSGFSDQGIFSRLEEYGLAGYLKKPFKISELLAKVENALTRRRREH